MQHQTTFKTSPLPRCFSAMEPSIPALGWMAWKIEEDDTARSPNIYTVIKIFKDIQNDEDILRIQRRARGTVRPPSKKYATIKTRLQTLKERYQNGIIDLMRFHQKYYIWDKDLKAPLIMMAFIMLSIIFLCCQIILIGTYICQLHIAL